MDTSNKAFSLSSRHLLWSGGGLLPHKIIVDTDMGMDVDDVGAVTLANALHMSGEA